MEIMNPFASLLALGYQCLQYRFCQRYLEGAFIGAGTDTANVLTPRHELSIAVPLTPRFFENRLNGWIGLKQRVA